jgi:ribose/xylose/arabinose/galactoside ABC-type transport system permease subunit
VGIAVVLAVIYLVDRQGAFFSPYSRETMLHQVALFGVLSVGAAVVIIAGGIDLSVGSVVALSGVVCAKCLTEWLGPLWGGAGPAPPPVVVLAAGMTLALGLAVGLLHALLINLLRLPPFIATLATMAGLRSVARLISQSTVTVNNMTFRMFGRSTWWSLAIFATVATAASLMMGSTVLGRHLFALGGNETAARLNGLATRRLKTFAYALSGALAALGGLLFTGKSGQGDPEMGVSYELYAITAAVVGGCSLSGGVGSVRGTVLGLILLQIVIKGTSQVPIFRGVDSTRIEGLVLGTIIVLAVAFNQRLRGRG